MTQNADAEGATLVVPRVSIPRRRFASLFNLAPGCADAHCHDAWARHSGPGLRILSCTPSVAGEPNDGAPQQLGNNYSMDLIRRTGIWQSCERIRLLVLSRCGAMGRTNKCGAAESPSRADQSTYTAKCQKDSRLTQNRLRVSSGPRVWKAGWVCKRRARIPRKPTSRALPT